MRITPSSSVGQTIIWTRSAGWIVACAGTETLPRLVYGKYAGGQERLVGAYLRRGRYADRHPCGERGGDPA